MIIFGYAKGYKYDQAGCLWIQVRIPQIHGPYKQRSENGTHVRNYTQDGALPYYQSLLLPYLPTEGEVVALSTMDDSVNELIVIGLTGATYGSGFLQT